MLIYLQMILDPDDRELLHLRYTHGYTVRECAALLGLSEAAVRKREQRAKIRFNNLCRTFQAAQHLPNLLSEKKASVPKLTNKVLGQFFAPQKPTALPVCFVGDAYMRPADCQNYVVAFVDRGAGNVCKGLSPLARSINQVFKQSLKNRPARQKGFFDTLGDAYMRPGAGSFEAAYTGRIYPAPTREQKVQFFYFGRKIVC